MRAVSTHEYELELKKWSPKIYKMAQSYIPYTENEDIRQEMRLVLYRCLQNFESGHGAIFHTYFHRAMTNRLGNLKSAMTTSIRPSDKRPGKYTGGKHNPPSNMMVSVDELQEQSINQEEGRGTSTVFKQLSVDPEDSLEFQLEMLGFMDLEIDWMVAKTMRLNVEDVAQLAGVSIERMQEAKESAEEWSREIKEEGLEQYAVA